MKRAFAFCDARLSTWVTVQLSRHPRRLIPPKSYPPKEDCYRPEDQSTPSDSMEQAPIPKDRERNFQRHDNRREQRADPPYRRIVEAVDNSYPKTIADHNYQHPTMGGQRPTLDITNGHDAGVR